MPDTADAPPRRGWRRTASFVLVAAVALLAVLRIGNGGGASSGFRADAAPRPLPEAQLAATDLDEFEGILAGLRGTPVVVNVWASWCAPCRAEMPLLERAAQSYEGRAVVLGVDSRDEPGAARAFLDDVGVTYPNVWDRTGAIRRALGLRGFPTTYFFDRDGTLVASVVGGVSEARLAAQLQDLT